MAISPEQLEEAKHKLGEGIVVFSQAPTDSYDSFTEATYERGVQIAAPVATVVEALGKPQPFNHPDNEHFVMPFRPLPDTSKQPDKRIGGYVKRWAKNEETGEYRVGEVVVKVRKPYYPLVSWTPLSWGIKLGLGPWIKQSADMAESVSGRHRQASNPASFSFWRDFDSRYSRAPADKPVHPTSGVRLLPSAEMNVHILHFRDTVVDVCAMLLVAAGGTLLEIHPGPEEPAAEGPPSLTIISGELDQ